MHDLFFLRIYNINRCWGLIHSLRRGYVVRKTIHIATGGKSVKSGMFHNETERNECAKSEFEYETGRMPTIKDQVE